MGINNQKKARDTALENEVKTDNKPKAGGVKPEPPCPPAAQAVPAQSPLDAFQPSGLQNTTKEGELPENLVVGKAYIFSALSSLEEVMGILCRAFGVEPEGLKDTLDLRNGDMVVHVSAACSSEGEGAQKYIKDQVQGTWAHFYDVKTGAVDVKTNLLYQLRWTQAFVLVEYAFIPDEDLDQKTEIEDMFVQTLDNLEALMLIQGDGEDSIYCQGDNGERVLVLSDSGGSAFRRYLPYQASVLKAGEDVSKEQLERRQRSRKVLEEQCIYVPDWYPVVESQEEVTCRSVEEIAKRAVALLCVSIYSEHLLSEEGSPEEARAFVEDVVSRYNARDFFSPKEWAYLTNPDSTKQERIQFSWQYENLFVMEWALGLVDELDFPDHVCDVPLTVRLLRDCDSIGHILKKTRPKSPRELLNACDLIFCLDWACVNARLHRLPAPAGMNPGVVKERHKSLNWLVGYGDSAPWDEVATDT